MFRFPWSSTAVTAAAAALSACGGGGGGGSDGNASPSAAPSPAPAPAPTPAPSPAPAPAPGDVSAPAPAPAPAPAEAPAPAPAPAVAAALPLPTDAQAARFLAQAGFAATPADIGVLKNIGYSAWLDLQFTAPRSEGYWDWAVRKGWGAETFKYYQYNALIHSTWRKLISSPDALRQRMVLALSEIFVVSAPSIDVPWRTMALCAYADLLEEHAFGNFAQLLKALATSPAMGLFLNIRGSRKEDTGSGRQPDENFARELMQLFTIGLVRLNADGTVQTSGGRAVETYTQQQVTELARVFTGWDLDATNTSGADYSFMRRPMKHNASQFSTGAKAVLGTPVPAGADGPTAMAFALDTLAAHPNVGPFFGRQLIQRLVCSHPSAAYVGRVAAAFNDNGQGVRGDLKAVLRAVLLDPEARFPVAGNASGKLREPVQRFVQFARTTGMNSASGNWEMWEYSEPSKLGQHPFYAPSVFSFYRPGYVPPNSQLGNHGITAPEFQLCNETTVAGYLNFMQGAINNGLADVKSDYTADLALAGDSRALVARQALLLAGDGISDSTQAQIAAALNTISAATEAGKLNRVKAGWMLLMACPEYQIQK